MDMVLIFNAGPLQRSPCPPTNWQAGQAVQQVLSDETIVLQGNDQAMSRGQKYAFDEQLHQWMAFGQKQLWSEIDQAIELHKAHSS